MAVLPILCNKGVRVVAEARHAAKSAIEDSSELTAVPADGVRKLSRVLPLAM